MFAGFIRIASGSLWMVEKTGLHRIDLEKREIYNYKLFKNIEFPEAWSIIEDNRDNLWIGTHFGLCRFNLNTGQTKVFSKEDGLPISIHQYNSVCKDKDGMLYFGGAGGFYSFHPDSIKTNTYIPPVVITDFRLFNKSVSVDTTDMAIITKNISLHQVRLNCTMTRMTFHSNLQLLIIPCHQETNMPTDWKVIRMNWVETDANNRVATYTNLDPGTYTFRVKGSNNDGVWNEEGASLTVIIHKPWWGTNLRLVYLYTGLSVCIIGGYIRWRL